jgi:iron complex outermembrane recepter protein
MFSIFKNFLTTLFIITFCTHLAGKADSCNLTLKGIAIDLASGNPLEFTVVYEKHRELMARTDHEGKFEIQNLCPGEYHFHLHHMLCEHLHIDIEIQNDTFIVFELPKSRHQIGTIYITEDHKAEVSRKLSRKLTNGDLQSLQGQSLGNIVERIPGITNISNGGTLFKPMINGMYGYRTLIINNGIRQEGQNWGQEHAPEIDPFIAKEIELLTGPAGLQYGPEGIGGILIVNPASVFNYRKNEIAVELHSGYQSNGRMGVSSASVGGRNFNKVPLYWRAQGTLRKQGNQKAPDYYLDNTGYREQNFSWMAGTHIGKFTADVYYSWFGSQFGIYSGAHIGNMTDLLNSFEGKKEPVDNGFSYELDLPRQDVVHELFKTRLHYKINHSQYLKLVLARQYNERKEFDLHRGNNEQPSFEYRITTHTADFYWDREGKNHLYQKVGISGITQANTYSGRFFIPNFKNNGGGLYYLVEYHKKSWNFSGSIRGDYRNLESYFYDNSGQLLTPQKTFMNIAAGLKAERMMKKNHALSLGIYRNWRPPMPNELYSSGIHHGAASFEQGNPELREEVSHKIEAEYLFSRNDKLYFSTNLYIQHVKDFINLVPQLPPVLTVRGAFPVFIFEQNDALIKGINQSFYWKPGKRFFLHQQSFILIADNLETEMLLAQMPPFSFVLEPGFVMGKTEFRLNNRFVLRQNRYVLGSDYVEPPPAYWVLGLEIR